MTYKGQELTDINDLIGACENNWYESSLTIKRAEVIKPDGTPVGEIISNLNGEYEFRPVQR